MNFVAILEAALDRFKVVEFELFGMGLWTV